MPRQEESVPVITRRSTRLSNQNRGKTTLIIEAAVEPLSEPLPKRRRITRNTFSVTTAHPCGSGDEGTSVVVKTTEPSTSDRRRSQRITAPELGRREKGLLQKERDFKHRSDDLEKRLLALAVKENEASLMLSQVADREAQSNLKQLEEHFTCALCYEVLAAPYALNPALCGHTFCALCILKWFFSRLHRACGGWHESVDCPICRSLLIITPEVPPRLLLTCPFVPNRIAAAIIESLIEKLAKPPLPSQAKMKREESEGVWSSQSKTHRGNECVRKWEKTEEKEPEVIPESVDVTVWGEGGLMRAEWLKKDREGKKEMAYLVKHWCTMGSQDFIALKQKLGV